MMIDRGRLSRRAWLKWAASSTTALLFASCTRSESVEPTAGPHKNPGAKLEGPAVTSTPAATQMPSPTAADLAAPGVKIEALLPEMIFIEAAEFLMGSDEGEENEKPAHSIHLSKNFYMGVYLVTFNEFDRYCDATFITRPQDEGFGRDDLPVIYVDWNDVVAYCNWLSEQAGLAPCYSGKGKVTKCDFSANGFRLPTEAEWEYTAKGGVSSSDKRYAGSDDPDQVAWYAENSNERTHPVGQKAPNELGLYDMSGNVWEWCWDKYLRTYYAESPESDPTGPEKGQENIYLGGWERVRRGGAANESPRALRVTSRSFDGQAYKGFVSGFRLVRTATRAET